MVALASTAVAATKYASQYTSTEAIVTVQYMVCTLLCLPRIARAGMKNLQTQRLANNERRTGLRENLLSIDLQQGLSVAGTQYGCIEHLPSSPGTQRPRDVLGALRQGAVD